MNHSSNRKYTHENQALDEIAKEAEARLAVKRAARLEAREMRKREINRQNSLRSSQQSQSNQQRPISHTNTYHTPAVRSNAVNGPDISGQNLIDGLPNHNQINNNDKATSLNVYHSNNIPRISITSDEYSTQSSADAATVTHYDHLDFAAYQNQILSQTYNNNCNNGEEEINSYHHLNMKNENQLIEDDEGEENYSSVENSILPGGNNTCDQDDCFVAADEDIDVILQKYKVLETKYNDAVIANAQLQNEIDTCKYQISDFKDDLDDIELKNHQIIREHKREHNELLVLRKNAESTNEELKRAKEQIAKRDQLLIDSNMVIIDVDSSTQDNSHAPDNDVKTGKTTLLNPYRSTMRLLPSPPSKLDEETRSHLDNDENNEDDLANNNSNSSNCHQHEVAHQQILLTQNTIQILKEFIEEQAKSNLYESLDSALTKLLATNRQMDTRFRELENELKIVKGNTKALTNGNHDLISNGVIIEDYDENRDFKNNLSPRLLNVSTNAVVPPSLNKTKISAASDKQNFSTANGALDIITRKLSSSSIASNASSQHKETQTPENEKENRRKLLEFEYKIQRYEQELSTMAVNLERAEANCERLRKSLETTEASESEIKTENRKLKRELRDAKQNVEELQVKIGHLERRLEKMRTTRLNAAVLTEIS